jgi:hypothetical protein
VVKVAVGGALGAAHATLAAIPARMPIDIAAAVSLLPAITLQMPL